MFYAEYRGTRIFAQATNPGTLSGQQFSQNFKGPIVVTIRDSDGVIQDMTGWTCSAGIVGTPGSPTGTPGGPPLAAYTAGMSWDGTAKTFTGILDCRTTQMSDLIGTADQKRTRFAFKFIKNDSTEQFEVSADVVMLAADIESGSTADIGFGPVAFTVAAGNPQVTFSFPNCPAGALLDFIKLSGGPGVDFYVVNVNDDDATQNTVTVTLTGNAAAGGQQFQAFVILP